MQHLKISAALKIERIDGVKVKRRGFRVVGLTGGMMDMPYESWKHFRVFETKEEAERLLFRMRGKHKLLNVEVNMEFWIYSGGANDAQGKAWAEASPEEVWF